MIIDVRFGAQINAHMLIMGVHCSGDHEIQEILNQKHLCPPCRAELVIFWAFKIKNTYMYFYPHKFLRLSVV